MKVPIEIKTGGRPRRRHAGALRPDDRVYDVHGLAQYALDSLEIDPVLQAVGRVRPFTGPREIITFLCGAHRSVDYSREFSSLAQARHHFGIATRRERRASDTRQNVISARSQGCTQRLTADRLGVGLRTVKRYWNAG